MGETSRFPVQTCARNAFWNTASWLQWNTTPNAAMTLDYFPKVREDKDRMNEQIETLGTVLPKEIERCQELLTQYASIGLAGEFGRAMINLHISAAHRAMMTGDCVAMLQAYEKLKACM